MDSKITSSLALFLSLNLLFFYLVSACCSSPNPKPKPNPRPSPSKAACPGVCTNMFGGLFGTVMGVPPKTPCCNVFLGLADFETAICLCTVLKANIIGVNLNVPLSISMFVNVCDTKIPDGFKCT